VMRVRVTHIHITRFVCHARVCTCHHRASCASSTCPFRPRAIGTSELRRRRRSLARAIVRTRCGGGDGGGGGGGGGGRVHRAARAMYVTRAHARVITAHGTRHQRFPSHARSARARCGVMAALARSLDHAHAVRGGGDGGGGRGQLIRASFASYASHVPFVSRACAASSPRVINVSLPSSPSRAIGTHALRRRWRSLPRSIARAVWRWRWRWVTPCVMRVRVTHIHITRFVCHAIA
jgi:hypothetical protein